MSETAVSVKEKTFIESMIPIIITFGHIIYTFGILVNTIDIPFLILEGEFGKSRPIS